MFSKELKLTAKADVIVCGGGTAGAFAAIAAAEHGKDVLIIEQYGSLGGTATNGLVTPFMHTHIADDPQCSYIAVKMKEIMLSYGFTDEGGRMFDTLGMKFALEELCAKSGVRILYHTFIADVVKDGSAVKQLVIANKNGLSLAEAKMYIDATGDGDVSVLAGAAYGKGNPETGKNQPISLRYIVGGIDIPALGAFFNEHAAETGVRDGTSYNPPYNFYGAVTASGTWAFSDLFDKAIAAGDLTPEDKCYWQAFVMPGRIDSIAFNNPEFFDKVDGTNPEDLTFTQIQGKKAILRQLRFYKKYLKGFENAYVAEVAAMVGIRESRNIITEYVLSAEDLLSRKKFDDAFAQSNYPVDIHGKQLNCKMNVRPIEDGKPYYEIPYRSLVVKDIDNLFVVGRCLGAEFLAQSSLRIQPTCRASGECAGIAAAFAIDSGVLPKAVDGKAVRAEMERCGAVFTKVGQQS